MDIRLGLFGVGVADSMGATEDGSVKMVGPCHIGVCGGI